MGRPQPHAFPLGLSKVSLGPSPWGVPGLLGGHAGSRVGWLSNLPSSLKWGNSARKAGVLAEAADSVEAPGREADLAAGLDEVSTCMVLPRMRLAPWRNGPVP